MEEFFKNPRNKGLVLGVGLGIIALVLFFVFPNGEEEGAVIEEPPPSTIPADTSQLSQFSTISMATLILQEDSYQTVLAEAFESPTSEINHDIKDSELREELKELAERFIVADSLGETEGEFAYLYPDNVPVANFNVNVLEINPVASVAGVNWQKSPKFEFACIDEPAHTHETEEEEIGCDTVDWRQTDYFQVYVLYKEIDKFSVADFRGQIVDIERTPDGLVIRR